MQSITALLDAAFRTAISTAFGINADPLIAPAQNEKFGDYQSNAAMGLAKQTQIKNPRAVAEQIIAKLDLGDIGTTSIAGPGFINVKLAAEWLQKTLVAMNNDPRLGIESVAKPQTVVIDYSGPNVAKQMHVGHLRSTIIGDAIARVLAFRGDQVIRQNHIGDWGTQFGMLIAHLRDIQPSGEPHIDDLDKFYKEARKRFDEDPAFADRARATVVALQSGEADADKRWQSIVAESRRHFQPIYDRLGVQLKPEDERGESFYNSQLAGNVAELKQMGVAVESDGATVAFTEGIEAPIILEKTGGGFGYATTDLAALRYRARDLGATRLIYFVGSPQTQHFKQVFATAQKAGWANGIALEHAAFGSVLGQDRKMFKARSGDSVKLVDLLDEAEVRAQKIVDEKSPQLSADERKNIARAVGIGAVKYADLSKDRLSDYIFDWDTMLSMDGNTGPYLQYAHARIQSIFRKASEQQALPGDLLLTEPAELTLGKFLLRFGDVIASVARELKPHLLCLYLYDLATTFSAFYENCPVLKSEPAIRASRLTLCELTGRTIALGLDLLGIEHPDIM
ncbi:MAG: arginine--tRNA ligase [Phycisphaerae bacterium]|nr:arginine--tRNA ligase [Phycisphaerae bacterium]